jgi:hypothetical protein
MRGKIGGETAAVEENARRVRKKAAPPWMAAENLLAVIF